MSGITCRGCGDIRSLSPGPCHRCGFDPEGRPRLPSEAQMVRDNRSADAKLLADIYRKLNHDGLEGLLKMPDPFGVRSAIMEALHAQHERTPYVQGGQWISVKDRLPTHIHTVLIVVVDDQSYMGESYIDMGIYNDKRGKWQMNLGDDDIDVKVSHWMPKPDMPARISNGD